ncbi:hypothetical protein [Nocardia sp. NRRL S-836]|uniref:hypothetical protein n=1 Tax=Nocardia sp. NRRL S-836 TaxID=1519492 RepID=UPI0006AF1AD4|nr:hypothetical protein [Nocardia sp. NRRL S-836]KOV82147.1 hypothetical protein ADL03_25880 [Nocardia sp. NRRL S-836]
MNITPEVPRLDPVRVQVRKHALLNEISTKPARRWWRFTVPATVLTAGVVAGTLLWTPTTPSAYASWTAEPRAPGPEADGLVAGCREELARHDRTIRQDLPNWPAMPTEVSIVDQRGDLTLVLFTGPQSDQTCLGTPKGIEVQGGGGDPRGRPPLGSAKFSLEGSQVSNPDPGRGEPRRTVLARVSPDVVKARLETADGRKVTATIGNGWLIAWWPTLSEATKITLYDGEGEVIATESVGFK